MPKKEDIIVIVPLLTDGDPYKPPAVLAQDVEKYLRATIPEYFTGRRRTLRFVGNTVEKALSQVTELPVGRPPSIYADIGLRESLDLDEQRDAELERGLKAIGKKYGIDLSIHPLSYGK